MWDPCSVEDVTTDSRLQILKYQYNEGAHELQSAGDFLGVCGVLDKLHKDMKVHGDVRLANMILITV